MSKSKKRHQGRRKDSPMQRCGVVQTADPEELRALLEAEGHEVTDEEFEQIVRGPDEVWGSDRYYCGVDYLGDAGRAGMVHLSIHDKARRPIRDWRDLQRIKNEVMGPEREAVELYPAESRLVDTANEFHLWVFPEGDRVPIGWTTRAVADHLVLGKGRQRPLDG